MFRIWVVLLAGALAALGALYVSPQAIGATGIKVCGSGNGHGVGLSQYGAYGRAKAGQDYQRIVKAYYRGVDLRKTSDNPSVRVLLGDRSVDYGYDVSIRSGSKARLRNLATGDAVALRPAVYRVRYLPAKKLYRVENRSTGRQVGAFRGPVRFERVSGSFLAYGGKTYRGMIGAQEQNGKLYLVNRLPMEGYIRGVVPNEMPSSWSSEALESQAVAARSYAYATRKDGPFDFYSDVRSQVYGGASSETSSTNAAVAGTSRVIATRDGKAIVAFFHSSSAGYTEDSSYVFSPSPYLKAVRDVDAQGDRFEARSNSPWLRWSGTLDPNGSSQFGVGSIERVRVLDRSPSGRVTKIEVTGSRGTKTVSGQGDIRFGLKTNGLRRADGSSYPAGYLPSARVSFGADCA